MLSGKITMSRESLAEALAMHLSSHMTAGVKVAAWKLNRDGTADVVFEQDDSTPRVQQGQTRRLAAVPTGPVVDWSCPPGVEEQTWGEWMAIRTKSNAPMSARIYGDTLAQLEAFEKQGLAPQDVVSRTVDASLAGLWRPMEAA